MKLVWVIREMSHIGWVDGYLQSLLKCVGAEFLMVEIYCTALDRGAECMRASDMMAKDLEKGRDVASEVTAAAKELAICTPRPGRPDMDAIMDSLIGGRVAIIGKALFACFHSPASWTCL